MLKKEIIQETKIRAVARKKEGLRQYPWLNYPLSYLGSSLNNLKTSLNFGSIIKKEMPESML